jgi:hypothetical protein
MIGSAVLADLETQKGKTRARVLLFVITVDPTKDANPNVVHQVILHKDTPVDPKKAAGSRVSRWRTASPRGRCGGRKRANWPVAAPSGPAPKPRVLAACVGLTGTFQGLLFHHRRSSAGSNYPEGSPPSCKG